MCLYVLSTPLLCDTWTWTLAAWLEFPGSAYSVDGIGPQRGWGGADGAGVEASPEAIHTAMSSAKLATASAAAASSPTGAVERAASVTPLRSCVPRSNQPQVIARAGRMIGVEMEAHHFQRKPAGIRHTHRICKRAESVDKGSARGSARLDGAGYLGGYHLPKRTHVVARKRLQRISGGSAEPPRAVE